MGNIISLKRKSTIKLCTASATSRSQKCFSLHLRRWGVSCSSLKNVPSQTTYCTTFSCLFHELRICFPQTLPLSHPSVWGHRFDHLRFWSVHYCYCCLWNGETPPFVLTTKVPLFSFIGYFALLILLFLPLCVHIFSVCYSTLRHWNKKSNERILLVDV